MTLSAVYPSIQVTEFQVVELRRAVAIYVALAYPQGEIPEPVQRRLARLNRQDGWLNLNGPPFEPSGPTGSEWSVFSIRLGNEHYPHMKLQVQAWPTEAGFMVSVNTHDQVFAPQPGSQEAERFRRLQADNLRMKTQIEMAWDEGGLPTFLRYLRDYIEEAGRAAV